MNIMKKAVRTAAALILGGVLLFQGLAPAALTGSDTVWAEELTDVWQPGGSETREAICIDDSADEIQSAVTSLLARTGDGKRIWDMGGDYAFNDLGKRSSGNLRQSLYQNIAAACASFAGNSADVQDYKGYYVISVIPLLDSGITLTADEAVETYFMFRSDNPQYYWLSNQVIYSSKDGSVNRLYLAVYPDFISGALRNAIASDLEAKLEGYCRLAEAAGESRAARIAAIYEKLSADISYSASVDDGWVHTIAGAFGAQGHTAAVCEGFSKLLQVVMNALGIPNLFVAGNLTTTGVGHAWNIVQLEDGCYYGLDATWDNGSPRGSWTYFLSGTDTFETNHTPLTPQQTGARFQYDLPAMSEAASAAGAAENVPPQGGSESGSNPPEESGSENPSEGGSEGAGGKLAITSVEVSEVTADGYLVTAVFTAPAGVKEVLMPTWTEAGGQDDLVWHRAEVSGNTAVFRVKRSDHKGETGRYITHVYVRDLAGNETLKGTNATVGDSAGQAGQNPGVTTLAVTDVSIENVSAQGYLVKASFTSPRQVSEVLMPTWTAAGGQDDLVWHRAEVSGNTASFFVKTADHRGEGGKYITHVYVKDVSGAQALKGAEVTVPGTAQTTDATAISSVWTSDVTSEGYTVHVAFTGSAAEVLMPSWTEAGGQDDLIWHKAEISGNSASFRVRAADHRGENGTYVTHVYLKGRDGSQKIAGIKASVPAGGNAPNQSASGQSQATYNNLDYSPVFNAEYYLNAYPDLRAAFGNDAQAALRHFIQYGMKEGRIGCSSFNVHIYRERYTDLQAAFGADLPAYYLHYLQHGYREHRVAC